MSKKKDYIVLYALLGIYIFITLCFYGYQELLKLKEKRKNTYLIINNNVKIQYENGKWTDIDDSEKYNMIDYDVYINSVKLGNYKIQQLNNKWYLFDDERNSIKYNGQLLAINTKRDFKAIEYKEEAINSIDRENLVELLKNHEITKFSLNMKEKVTLDFDGDGDIETLYAVSNAFIVNEQKCFSLLYIVDDNKTTILKQVFKNIGSEHVIPLMDIVSIIDIDDDNKYEIIVDESYFDNIRPCHSMYQYDGKVNVLKACEEE